MTSTVGERGQVTIPKEIRERFGIRPGDRVRFSIEDDQILLLRELSTDPLQQLVGLVSDGRRTDEVMDALRGPAPGVGAA